MERELSPEDLQELQRLIEMVRMTITHEESITERGADTVAIFANSLLGISEMAAALAAKHGVRIQRISAPTPLEWRG